MLGGWYLHLLDLVGADALVTTRGRPLTLLLLLVLIRGVGVLRVVARAAMRPRGVIQYALGVGDVIWEKTKQRHVFYVE